MEWLVPDLSWTTARPSDDPKEDGIAFATEDDFILVRESSEPALALHLTRGEASDFLWAIEAGERLGVLGEVTVYVMEHQVALSTCSAEIQTTTDKYHTFVNGVLEGAFNKYKLTP